MESLKAGLRLAWSGNLRRSDPLGSTALGRRGLSRLELVGAEQTITVRVQGSIVPAKAWQNLGLRL